MSKRESRNSIGVRHDALLEFENFKKKFLLANKHITKLNSTLSVRIEELNAQISTLYVENLRLRASEIALTSQLKKERDKSRRVMADAEAATSSLGKHLTLLRHSFNIPSGRSSPVSPPTPPRAIVNVRSRQQQQPNPNSPPRLARAPAPSIPGINEEDELSSSASPLLGEDRGSGDASPTRRKSKEKEREKVKEREKAAKVRLAASKLPLPSRVASPPLSSFPEQAIDSALVGKKSSSGRRQSGLLGVNHPPFRPSSPAFGSPIRREAGLAAAGDNEVDDIEDEDEGEEAEVEVEVMRINGLRRMDDPRRVRGKKEGVKERERMSNPSERNGVVRERKRARDENEDDSGAGGKLKLKDVTNSPRGRDTLPALDVTGSDHDRQRTPDTEPPSSATTTTTARTFLSTPATTPISTTSSSTSSYLPTPHSSSSPQPPPAEEVATGEAATGESAEASRESRRTRKSVNYAEPKLNTKMRKPDPPPGFQSTAAGGGGGGRKRSSTSTVTSTTRSLLVNGTDGAGSDREEVAFRSRSSLEMPLMSQSNLNVPSRPSSTASYFEPPSRPPSTTAATSSTSSAKPASASTSTATTNIKRKKSRPYIDFDDDDGDDDDGADADGEYVPSGSTWVNLEGRRRSVQAGGARRAPADDDGRRRSMAV